MTNNIESRRSASVFVLRLGPARVQGDIPREPAPVMHKFRAIVSAIAKMPVNLALDQPGMRKYISPETNAQASLSITTCAAS